MDEGQITIEDYETGNTKHKWNLKKIKLAHSVLFDYNFNKGVLKGGYANRTLFINLSKWMFPQLLKMSFMVLQQGC